MKIGENKMKNNENNKPNKSIVDEELGVQYYEFEEHYIFILDTNKYEEQMRILLMKNEYTREEAYKATKKYFRKKFSEKYNIPM